MHTIPTMNKGKTKDVENKGYNDNKPNQDSSSNQASGKQDEPATTGVNFRSDTAEVNDNMSDPTSSHTGNSEANEAVKRRKLSTAKRLKKLMGAEDGLFGPMPIAQVVRIAVAELLGTGMLLFLGCMGSVIGLVNPPHPHLLSALTFGLVIMIAIQSIGHISKAHINPAITVALVVIGDLNVPLAVVYIISQVIGATLGYGALLAITPARVLKESAPSGSCCALCVTLVSKELTLLQGLLAEFLVTSMLILVLCSVFDKRNAHNTDCTSLKFGLTVAVIAMAEGPYTGGSMNPARSFGPAVWTGVWTNHWVYWVGPLAAGILTAAIYRLVFGVSNESPPSPQKAK